MDDSCNPQWDNYSMVLTRDGPGWRATLRGEGLPGDGKFIRDRTIAALNARTSELFDELPDRSCWHLEYSSAASPVALHEWHMSRLNVGREHGPQGCPGRSACNRNRRAPRAAEAGWPGRLKAEHHWRVRDVTGNQRR